MDNPGSVADVYATLEILNKSPTVSVAASAPANETGSTPGTFTFTRSYATDFVTWVYFDVSGTAVEGSDFANIGLHEGIVGIPANATSVTVTITPYNDSTCEGAAEDITVTLVNQDDYEQPVSYDIGTASATLEILDGGPTSGTFDRPTVTVGDWSGSESEGPADFQLTLSSACSRPLYVQYTTSSGTATDAAPHPDFSTKVGSYLFPASTTEYVIEVPLVNDVYDEPNETFTLTATVSGGASDTGQATILDVGSDNPLEAGGDPNDPEDDSDDPHPYISINDVAAHEFAGYAVFTVTVSPISGKSVSVNYETTFLQGNGHASPDDIQPVQSTLVIPPYHASGAIQIRIANDSVDEVDEDYRIKLTSPINAVLSDDEAIGVIIDNDDPARQILLTCPDCIQTPILDILLAAGGPAGVAYSLGPSGQSCYPVRYTDGVVNISSKDIDSPGFGLPWGVSRSWTNGEGYMSQTNVMGNGWVPTEQPVILPVNGYDTVSLITNSHTARYFDWSNGVYESRFFLQETLTRDLNAKEFILRDTTGAVLRFHDFEPSWPLWQRGRLKSYTDPTGQKVEAIDHDNDGRILEVQRSYENGGGNALESFQYSYVTTGLNAGLVASVVWRKQATGGPWMTQREAVYEYYNGEPHGNQSDLKRVTIKDGNGSTIDRTYYRYYTGETGGFVGGLKYVFYPESYARLVAQFGEGILSASDETIKDYADHYFEYDAERRATKEIAQGAGCSSNGSAGGDGLGQFHFSYTESQNPEGFNSWAMKTVETLPDSTPENLEDNDRNIVYTNVHGQVMLQIFRDTSENKEWSTFYEYEEETGRVLKRAEPSAITGYSEQNADLLGKTGGNYQYLDDDDGLITEYSYYTETNSGTGAADGYLETVQLRKGEQGAAVPQTRQTYVAHTIRGTTTYQVATSTSYVGNNGTAPLTTSYVYTGTNQIETIEVTDPLLGISKTVYDSLGRPIWIRDAAGFLHYTKYDTWSGAVSRSITDVDTNQTGDFANLPNGWGTPAGGGQHVVTEFSADSFGRPISIRDGNEHETRMTYNDSAHETRVYGYDMTYVGPVAISRESRDHNYVESRLISGDIGNSPVTEALSRTFRNSAGQAVYTDEYFDLSSLTYATSPSLGTEGTHFHRTLYAYDSRGRLNKTTRPDGTIYRTVYDSLGRVVSEWIGDNDSGWSDTAGAAGMTLVQQYEYDGGQVGDSLLTMVTDALGRSTETEYDFRGRPLVVTLPDADSPAGTNRPTYETTYDNLGRVVTQTDPLGNVTAIAYTLDTTNHLSLVTTTLPDPDGAGPGQSPVAVEVYDVRGQLVKVVDASGRETRYAYDGAGRLIKVAQVNPGEPEGNWPATHYVYDAAGNLIAVIDPLGNETERQYDELNRLTDVVEPDPDGSGPKERPHTQYAYDAAGRRLSLTDPMGNATTWYYDALGRVVQETNQLGHSRYFSYDAAGRLAERVDRLGRVMQFDYNLLGQAVEERWYSGAQLVRTITHEYDDAGQLLEASDPLAATYGYGYDRLGRVTGQTQAIEGFDPALEIEYSSAYNLAGGRTSVAATIGTTLDFQNGYTYDDLGRMTSVTQQGQTGTTVHTVAQKRIDFGYNAGGQVLSLLRFKDVAGNDSVANTFSKYDPLGRLESLIHTLDGSAPTSGWGTDPLAGYVYTYDAASRIWSVASMVDGLIDYAYDHTGQLTGADYADQGLADESYSYDANGNRVGAGYETGPNNQLLTDGTYTYVYDVEGNRVRRTKISDGTFTVYAYDHRNRLTGVQDFDISVASTVGQPTDWGWGLATGGGTLPIEDYGEGTSWGWGYSGANPQATTNEPCGGEEQDPCESVSFGASVASAVEGQDIVITFQAHGSSGVSAEIWFVNVSADDTDYASGSGVIQIDLPALVPYDYHISTVLDAIGEPTESFAIHMRVAGYPDSVQIAEADIFDGTGGAGYSAAVSPAVEGEPVLLTVSAGAALDFEYWVENVSAIQGEHFLDAGGSSSGNWVSVPANWQLEFPTVYSAAVESTRSFRIYVRLVNNPDSQMVLEADIFDREELTVQSVEYAYDVYNQLVRRTLDDDGQAGTNPPVETFYSWEAGQIAMEFEGGSSSAPSHRYLWNPTATDQLFADENALNEVLWAANDHLGTARDLLQYDETEEEGVVVNHRFFDSFGRLLYQSDDGYTIVFGFTGVYFEIATGLQNHRNRWYDVELGRWVSEDPLGFDAGDTNLARYVSNNPTNLVDPTGNWGIPIVFMDPLTLSSNMEKVSPTLLTIGGIFVEPLDWIMTGKEIYDDPKNPWSYAGMAPFVPAAVGKVGKKGTKLVKGAIEGAAEKTAKNAASDCPDLRRPYIRKNVKDEVEARAPRTADGRPIDPNTGEPINGKPDLGHKPGNEFWREQQRAQAEGLSQKEFNDRMNNPDLYQLEDPSSNRSHQFELPRAPQPPR